MIGYDQTITIYNKWYDAINNKVYWRKTVIPAASWHGARRVTTGEGLTTNDSYSVRILKHDMPEGFVLRDEYISLTDPAGYWTAQAGDVVVLGSGADAASGITDITKRYTDCFVVTVVHTANLKRLIPHLRLEGK